MKKIKNIIFVISIIFITLFFFSFYDPINDYKFINFTMKDGLESLVIYSIYQDQNGFLWFGGEGGLTRYDGKYFKSFRNDPLDTQSISSNNISSIFVDFNNNIWIGTWGGGLNKFDSYSGTFVNYKYDPDNPASISGNRVQVVYRDRKKRLWAGTYKNGLNRFENGKFIHYFESTPSKRIWTISEDASSKVWVGTSYGLYYYDEKEDNFKQVLLKNTTIRRLYGDEEGLLWIGTENGLYVYDITVNKIEFLSEIPEVPINAIVRSRNILWIGTYGKGLIRYDIVTKKYVIISSQQNFNNWLPHNDVRALFVDKSLNLWIGTRGGGLSKLDIKPSYFYSFNKSIFKVLKHNKVLSFEYLNDRYVIIGTNGGLNLFDIKNKNLLEVSIINNSNSSKSKNKKNNINNNINNINNNNNNNNNNNKSNNILKGKILSILKLDDNYLLVSVKEKGLIKFKYNLITQNNTTKLLLEIVNDFNKEKSKIPTNIINKIYKDRNRIFVCTDDGLYIFDKEDNLFKNFVFNNNKIISSQVVNDIEKVSENGYLIATESGLLKINILKNSLNIIDSFINFNEKYKESLKITNFLNLTHSIIDKNYIWIGTANGLMRYDIKTEKIKLIFKPFLYNIYISGIVEDNEGNLWISTKYGILRYNAKEDFIKSYYNLKGVLKEYINNSFLINKNNDIFFGSLNGFTYFNPKRLLMYNIIPNIQIIALKINDKDVLKNKDFKALNKIIVPPGRNKVYIEFSCLDFTYPEKNLYSYKLEGFDNKWVDNGNKNFVIFTNLVGGEYTLKIKAANYNGVWNKKGIKINFFVKTPIYLQWYFFLLYAVVLFLIIYIIVRIKTRLNEIEIEKQKLSIRELKELDEIKDEFFNNIAKELEIPVRKVISLLKSMVEYSTNLKKLLDKYDPDTEMLKKNNKRANHPGDAFCNSFDQSLIALLSINVNLIRLINEIVLYSKLKTNDLTFEFNKIDLYSIIERVIYLSIFFSGRKDIKIINNIKAESVEIYGDWIKLEQAFFYIFENSIKYTECKQIVINGNIRDKNVIISIKDDGKGISKELVKIISNIDKDTLSEEYYKHSQIGLNLIVAKKIIENHGGSFYINSKINKGTTTYFSFPLYNQEQKIDKIQSKKVNVSEENELKFEQIVANIEDKIISQSDEIKKQLSSFEKNNISIKGTDKQTVLICENDLSTITVLKNYFSTKDCNFIIYKNIEDVLYSLIKNDIKIDLLIVSSSIKGKKSFDLIQYIRSKFSYYELPILLIVDRNEILDHEFLLKLGINDIIYRPIYFEDFKFKTNTFLKLKEEIDKNEILNENIKFKNYLIRIIGHDLKNPLSVILISINALKSNVLDKNSKKYLDFLEKSTLIIQDILNNFLEYAKITSGKIELKKDEQDIIILIKKSVQEFLLLAKDKNQNIKFKYSLDKIVFKFDKFLIKRVVDNLLSNAIKYSSLDSSIVINVKIHYKNMQKYFYFEVVDSGNGIKENEISLLFKPFQKLSSIPTKGEASTGLGLAIAKSIVDLHNGIIGYKKNKNGNSVFYFELPM